MKAFNSPFFSMVVAAAIALWIFPCHAAAPKWTSNSTVKKLAIVADGEVDVLLDPHYLGAFRTGIAGQHLPPFTRVIQELSNKG